ncbi:hypothetical protein Trihar35433_11273 [Trichoderma harzianum]|nr:hypothetical protein Trihar35433_11273 [Trichoderma harzianum]
MPSTTLQAGAQRPRPRPATTRCQWIAVTVILCVAMITSVLALVAFFDYRVKLAEIARTTTTTTTTITITTTTTTTTSSTITTAAAASPLGMCLLEEFYF